MTLSFPEIPSEKKTSASEWIASCETFTNRYGHHLSYRRRGTGPAILLLHGFPTWSYDYADVAGDLERDHDVITLDFLGYGASEKPTTNEYSVSRSADAIEDLLEHLKVPSIRLVIHDYGGIVGQELLDRQLAGKAPFAITDVTILNCGIVYSAYRPTMLQKLLIVPFLGKLISGQITPAKTRTALEGVFGKRKLTDEEFENHWHGISLNNGHKLAHLHIRYNTEREHHHQRWEEALKKWEGPVHLVWGLDDPVSGRHVLELAGKNYPRAMVTELPNVGHYPQVEAPNAVVAAIRQLAPPVKASL